MVKNWPKHVGEFLIHLNITIILMCCFNKVNLSAILLVYKCIINKDCTVENNEIKFWSSQQEEIHFKQANTGALRSADCSHLPTLRNHLPIFKVPKAQGFLSLEDGTYRLSQKYCNYLPIIAVYTS